MTKQIRLKRGLDIPLKGEASDTTETIISPTYGIVPDDFPGHTWKLKVAAGDLVSSGDPLMYSKEYPELRLTSPVTGIVKEIRRGERRHIEAVVVESNADANISSDRAHISGSLRERLCATGLWTLIRQRPFDIVPNPDSDPRDIFITAFDSAPLAPELLVGKDLPYLSAGINALKELTKGKVYIGVRKLLNINTDAEQIIFEGPHPSGNVGVQIANVKPVNKGETVWTLDVSTAVRIGKLVTEDVVDYSAHIAVTGPEIENPHYVDTYCGASISSILEHFTTKDSQDIRIISGNVLTGKKIDGKDGFLRYPYRQITVIAEGSHADEFMGWASLDPSKYSVKRSFPSFWHKAGKLFDFDSRIKGGHRAMILSGEYDKVIPMDIYPEFLIKAIQSGDIDRMEKLGIYEVAPEDFALAEFVDTSKLPLQKIVSDGLEQLRKELS